MKLKILHIIEGLDKKLGGLPFALASIQGLEELLGIESTILSLVESSSDIDRSSFKSAKLVLFQSSFPKRLRNSKKAIEWASNSLRNYDLLIFHSTWSILNLRIASVSKSCKIPYVIWPHGSLDPFDLKKKKLLKLSLGRFFVRNYLRNAEYLCCTSTREASEIMSFGLTIKRAVLPLAICKGETASEEMVKEFRNKHQIKTNEKVLLFLSRINYKKGIDTIIKSFEYLDPEFKSNLKIIVAGSGDEDYVNGLKSMIDREELSNNIIFCGHLSDLDKASAFQASDLFILPSQNENFGIVIIEALNSGLPVIISENVYIWKEIISEGAGWITNLNPDSLAKLIQDIYISDSIFEKSQKAIQTGDRFSPDSLLQTYKDFYEIYSK